MKSMSKTADGSFNDTTIERVDKIINFNDKLFKDSTLNEYYFWDVRFLFVNNRFSNSLVLNPPSSILYSKKNNIPIIENPFGLEILRQNCLTGLYISYPRLFTNERNVKRKKLIGNNQFLLSNSYKVNRKLSTANGELELTLVHNWNLSDVKQVSSVIVDALKTQNSIPKNRLTEEIILLIHKNNLKGHQS